jgi:hypothetical protein
MIPFNCRRSASFPGCTAMETSNVLGREPAECGEQTGVRVSGTEDFWAK